MKVIAVIQDSEEIKKILAHPGCMAAEQ